MSQSPLGLSEDLLKRILYLLGALVIFRLGTHIVIPFISQTALASLVEDNRDGILGMFNMFSGGALERLSIFTLGIMPYISSSIIMTLMTSVVPHFEQLKKEGERGRKKNYTVHTYGYCIFGSLPVLWYLYCIAISIEGECCSSN